MNLAAARELARRGQLYPSVILHGGDAARRQQAALDLGRILLCEQPPEERPCGRCRHCRRIAWPGDEREGGETPFHPDFQVLERDLKTSTSVEATREMLKTAQVSPFEARGQVFVVASAESLSGEAANALLKSLEEPHTSAPRNFFLLAPSRLDLLPTLRSRSFSLFLGPAEPVDRDASEALARSFADAAGSYAATGAPIFLLAAAEALNAAGSVDGKGGWDDPRSGRPWALAAAAVLRALELPPGGAGEGAPLLRPACLALAEALLEGPGLRLRGVTPERILEGFVSRHLA
jgi:DNA polymerase-3 subunit delta'